MVFSILFIMMGALFIIVSFLKGENIGYFGYKSSTSCENEKNWKFANILAGVISFIGSVILYIVSLNSSGIGLLVVLSVVILVLMIIFVEVALIVFEKIHKSE